MRIYTETNYQPIHTNRNFQNNKPESQFSENRSVSSRNRSLKHKGPVIKMKTQRNRLYTLNDRRSQNSTSQQNLNKSYSNIRPRYETGGTLNRSSNSYLLNQSVQSHNPRISNSKQIMNNRLNTTNFETNNSIKMSKKTQPYVTGEIGERSSNSNIINQQNTERSHIPENNVSYTESTQRYRVNTRETNGQNPSYTELSQSNRANTKEINGQNPSHTESTQRYRVNTRESNNQNPSYTESTQRYQGNTSQNNESVNYANSHSRQSLGQTNQSQIRRVNDSSMNQPRIISKQNMEAYTHEDPNQSLNHTRNDSVTMGVFHDYYGKMTKETIDLANNNNNISESQMMESQVRNQDGEWEPRKINQSGRNNNSYNRTTNIESSSKTSDNLTHVRSSYSRQIDGEIKNTSSVIKETKNVKVIRSSVKDHPKSTREISRNVYETIQTGTPMEGRKSETTRRSMEVRREVPKIVERIVEVPYTVIREKPVPNYIYKDVVTEVFLETKQDIVIENNVEETIEREVENLIEKEKITEVIQEVEIEKIKEKKIYYDKQNPSQQNSTNQTQTQNEANSNQRENNERNPMSNQVNKLEIDEDMLERVSVKEENDVEYRTYYVKVPQDKYVDVEDIEYKNVDVERKVEKKIERVTYKDVEKPEVKYVEVEEEEIIIEKKDRIVDVFQNVDEEIRKVVKVPKTRKVQIYKDVEVEREVFEEVPVNVYRDKEVVVVKEVDVPREVHVSKEVPIDIFENTERPEYIQKVIETEREFEVNITKMKPKYKEVPINRYQDVVVNVNEFTPVEEIRTINKKRDVIVPKIVEKIVQVPKYIEKKVEKEVEQIKYVSVPVYRDVIVEKEIPVIVEKHVEVPVKKYVEKKIYKEIEKEVEIEIIEENPILVENEVYETINVDVAGESLRENLVNKNIEKEQLQNEAIELKRELRKSHKRKSERRKSQKKYKYLGKEENRNLRKELTQLHREYRNVVKETTSNQIQDMQNSEIVKVIDRRKMDSNTIQELKKSGVIKEGMVTTEANLTPGIRTSQQVTNSRRVNPETERVMNETLRTYQTIGSHIQLGNQVNYQKSISNTCLLYTSPSPRDLSTSRMPSSA